MPLDEYWERQYYARGNPEPDVCPVLERLFGDGVCFYDLGAHIGFYSLMAWKRGCNPVFAFEPDPQNAALCREIFLRNHAPAEVTEQAVSDSCGIVAFSRSGGINISSRIYEGGEFNVECTTFDAFVRCHSAPDLIKTLRGLSYKCWLERPTYCSKGNRR